MPKIQLTQQFSDNPPVNRDKPKTDYFDTQIPGFLLEVRSSGKATYYQRYRDKYARMKQSRIGPADAISLEEARHKARQIRTATVMGFDPNAEVLKYREMPTFKEFVESRYLPHVKVYKRSWHRDEQMIANHLLPVWGQAKLSEIAREDIQQFLSDLLAAGYKPGSVNRFMSLVKYIFNLAEKWEVIDKSPSRGVSKVADNNRKERFLTKEEIERLLAALKQSKSLVLPDLIEFLLLTGARKSEASNARWENVNLETGIWTVPVSKSGKPRYIPLSRAAVQVLARRKTNGSEYVFPNPKTGKPLSHLYESWHRIRTMAGLQDVRIHDIRHHVASLLVNHGRSLYEVQKLLGHADISTTQRYAHLSQGTLKDAIEIVASGLKSDSTIEEK
jgi:integrase